MLFNKPLYATSVPLDILLFCDDKTNVEQIEDLIYSTCKNFKLNCKMKTQRLNFRDRNVMN